MLNILKLKAMKTQIVTTAFRNRATLLAILLLAGTIGFAQRRENNPPMNNHGSREYKQEQKSEKIDKDKKEHQAPKKDAYEKPNNYGHKNGQKDNKYRDDKKDYKYKNDRKDYDRGNRHEHKEYGHKPTPRYDGPAHYAHKEYKYRPKPYRYDYHVRHHNQYVKRLPHGTHWIHYNDTRYYFMDGFFYVHTPFGYRIADPPRYLHRLPAGCVKVWFDGTVYFSYHGIFFEHTPFGFRILI
jgi:hypothetical protein